MDTSADFRRIYKENYRAVHKAAMRRGLSKWDAEDLTQEVFVKAGLAFRHYDPARPLIPWLLEIANNEACSFHRLRQTRPLDAADLVRVDELADDSRDAEALIRLSQQWRFFMDRIDDLKSDRRTVFVMAEIDEKPNAEISATLQIPVTAVESKLRGARQELHAAVERARKAGTLPGIMLLGTAAAAEGAVPHPGLSLLRRAGRLLRASAVACLPGLVPGAAPPCPPRLPRHERKLPLRRLRRSCLRRRTPLGPLARCRRLPAHRFQTRQTKRAYLPKRESWPPARHRAACRFHTRRAPLERPVTTGANRPD